MFQTIFYSSKIDWPKLEFFQVSVMYTKIVENFVYIKVTSGQCYPITFCIHKVWIHNVCTGVFNRFVNNCWPRD